MLLLALACRNEPAPPDPVVEDSQDSRDSAPPFGLRERPENPSCLAPDRPQRPDALVAVEQAFPALDSFARTTGIYPTPDGERWVLLEHEGTLWSFDNRDDVETAEVFADLGDRVYQDGEAGLLGFAFAPDWDSSGVAYVSYTTGSEEQITSRISRFRSQDGGATLDVDTEEVVLELEQTGSNHNGGKIAFGPHDGLLYIAFGDGGGAGRKRTAADPSTFYGSLLRVAVEGTGDYAVPEDNPFGNETWAYGLRNPWGWSIDPLSGDIWAGDVGWNTWEEMNLLVSGGFYGWVYYEGDLCTKEEECLEYGQIDPVFMYGHDEGVSVTGGPVYRGSAIPGLAGAVLFTDFATGKLWALWQTTGEAEVQVLSDTTGLRVAHMAVGPGGEVFLPEFSYAASGRVFKLVPAGEVTEAVFPATLDETGCTDDVTIPYDVNVPFHSDAPDKQRWLALPDGERIEVAAEGTWSLPIGSVLGKHFSNDDSILETRLLVRHEDGAWAGYAYSGEGTLLESAVVLDGGYRVPSRTDCLRCHVDGPLGLTTGQLDRVASYPAGEYDQLATLQHIDVLDGDPGSGPWDPTDARTWLHVNCAHCHDGEQNGVTLDLRLDTPLEDMEACGVEPQGYDLGVEGALRVDPGSPSTSLVFLRLDVEAAHRMPPLGAQSVDAEGLALVEAWIEGLECP